MVLPKALAREVRRQAAQEPHQLHVPVGFSFQVAAGANAVEVAVDVEPKKVGWIVWGASQLMGNGMGEAQFH